MFVGGVVHGLAAAVIVLSPNFVGKGKPGHAHAHEHEHTNLVRHVVSFHGVAGNVWRDQTLLDLVCIHFPFLLEGCKSKGLESKRRHNGLGKY